MEIMKGQVSMFLSPDQVIKVLNEAHHRLCTNFMMDSTGDICDEYGDHRYTLFEATAIAEKYLHDGLLQGN